MSVNKEWILSDGHSTLQNKQRIIATGGDKSSRVEVGGPATNRRPFSCILQVARRNPARHRQAIWPRNLGRGSFTLVRVLVLVDRGTIQL